MAIKVFTKEKGIIRKISEQKSVLNLLTKNDSDKLSVGKITATNLDLKTNTDSDRAYYILNGELLIDEESGKTGDVIFVTSGSEYTMKGTFEAVLVNSPPFGFNQE